MRGAFAIEDLVLGGLGLEVVAAVLLARGLLSSPDLKRSGAHLGYNPELVEQQAHDFIAARFGLAYLAIGFIAQIVAYVVVLGAGAVTDPTALHAVVALAFAALAAAIGALVYRLLAPGQVRRCLGQIVADNPAHAEALRHLWGLAEEPG